jgi:hypothetical protein
MAKGLYLGPSILGRYAAAQANKAASRCAHLTVSGFKHRLHANAGSTLLLCHARRMKLLCIHGPVVPVSTTQAFEKMAPLQPYARRLSWRTADVAYVGSVAEKVPAIPCAAGSALRLSWLRGAAERSLEPTDGSWGQASRRKLRFGM